MIQYVIFDFDGTLADTQACVIASTQAAFEACHLQVPESTK